ncbi:hypothetical protein PDIG_00800 [Penicillium digitatum PHI26]|uniref:Uncharacterized protein n=2 Tax=Penicillium digitatum TaxID=36651 RepID=K9GF22_PEND2|nr:hypothetical protein PDIP_03060 [Penicillium digitatum Pd1]EKV19792.1 hypothetical protein PDIG_00800 [Penicillium digitatum PHI26]EKV21775.1 hypothetical protein PDIP_03060 [Penicillium digitatum Pd1]
MQDFPFEESSLKIYTIGNFQETYRQDPCYPGSPLFIMTHQEGGEVLQLAGIPVESAKQIGQGAECRSDTDGQRCREHP